MYANQALHLLSYSYSLHLIYFHTIFLYLLFLTHYLDYFLLLQYIVTLPLNIFISLHRLSVCFLQRLLCLLLFCYFLPFSFIFIKRLYYLYFHYVTCVHLWVVYTAFPVIFFYIFFLHKHLCLNSLFYHAFNVVVYLFCSIPFISFLHTPLYAISLFYNDYFQVITINLIS